MNLIKFDKKCICGPEFVCVRIIENSDDLEISGFYVPQMTHANERSALALIEDIGSKAAAELGVKAGDYVLIDRLSTFFHTYPVALLKYNNVLLKTDEKMADFWPLRNKVFVVPDSVEKTSTHNGLILPNTDGRLNSGTIAKINCDAELKLPFKEKDKVLLVKGGDVVCAGQIPIYIYDYSSLICKISEDENADTHSNE